MIKFDIESSDKFFSAEGLYNNVPGMKYVYETSKEVCRQILQEVGYYLPLEQKGEVYLIDDEVDMNVPDFLDDLSLIGDWELDEEIEYFLQTINSIKSENLYKVDCEYVGAQLARWILTII